MNKWILILVIVVLLVGANYVYSGITGKTIVEELKETIAGTQEGVSGQVVEGTEDVEDSDSGSGGGAAGFIGANITVVAKLP